MARLIIKKYKNTNEKNSGFGKTYGRLVHQGTVNGTIFTSDVVKGVVNTKTQRLRDKNLEKITLCVSESLCLNDVMEMGKKE